jgi:predicted GTPase
VSNSLGSCTQEVSVTPGFILDGRTVSLIDTPGFDDTDKSDAEIVQIIAAFLETQWVYGIYNDPPY